MSTAGRADASRYDDFLPWKSGQKPKRTLDQRRRRARYEAALYSRASIISRALRRLEIDCIAAEVESFVAALQRDLIDAPTSLASRPSRRDARSS